VAIGMITDESIYSITSVSIGDGSPRHRWALWQQGFASRGKLGNGGNIRLGPPDTPIPSRPHCVVPVQSV